MASESAPAQRNSVGNSESADDNYSKDDKVLSDYDSNVSSSHSSGISEILQGSNRLHIDVVDPLSSRAAERGFGAVVIGKRNSKRFALTRREVKMLNLPNAYNASGTWIWFGQWQVADTEFCAGPHIVQQRALPYKEEEDMLNEKKTLRLNVGFVFYF